MAETKALGLRLAGVKKSFGPSAALEAVDLSIKPGEFVAVLGPSGCGKSTLLRIIAGLERPSGGQARLEPAPERHDLAYVFQDAHLLPWRTALANVALPLELAGLDREHRLGRASETLAHVGLAGFEGHRPAELSGGMRMRVSLARALVTRPRLLLMDEPFAALDEMTRQRLDESLRGLWAESGATVVFVTHSVSEAVFLANRVLVMSERPGRILADLRVDKLPMERDQATRLSDSFAHEVRDVQRFLGSAAPSAQAAFTTGWSRP